MGSDEVHPRGGVRGSVRFLAPARFGTFLAFPDDDETAHASPAAAPSARRVVEVSVGRR